MKKRNRYLDSAGQALSKKLAQITGSESLADQVCLADEIEVSRALAFQAIEDCGKILDSDAVSSTTKTLALGMVKDSLSQVGTLISQHAKAQQAIGDRMSVAQLQAFLNVMLTIIDDMVPDQTLAGAIKAQMEMKAKVIDDPNYHPGDIDVTQVVNMRITYD